MQRSVLTNTPEEAVVSSGAVLVTQDSCVGGNGHAQKATVSTQNPFIVQYLPQRKMRQQRHGNHLEQHQHIRQPFRRFARIASAQSEQPTISMAIGVCDVSDIFDGLVQQHRWLPAGQINHERHQRRRNARLPQDFPLK